MKTAFIVNNTAGRNQTCRLWPRLEKCLREQQDFSVFFTPRKGTGGETACRAQKQGFNRLVVVGGDGTLHEVVNGVHLNGVELGIIPTGTGNDFCRSLGIPPDPFAAADYIFSGDLRKVDIGTINGHLFVNVAGVGFDAEVAHRVNSSRLLHRFSGTGAYLLGVLAELLQYRNTPMEISVDGTALNGEIFLAAVGNARYYGGGMKIVPQAEMDDGLFHLCIARNVNLWDALTTLPKMFSGRHLEHPKVTCIPGREITISSPRDLPVHADGEIVSKSPARFRILPAVLTVVCPPGEARP